jgi:uncharacterized protein (DUF2249 family)
MNSPTSEPIDLTHFDVRAIPCRVKHAQIFQRWTDLPVDRYFILINDHDPIPLYHQFTAQFPGAFSWEYLVSGPEEYQVKITRLTAAVGTSTPPASCQATIDPKTVFDVREIPGRIKHAQIFQRWFDLPVGGYFVLLNDHDPLPLRYQFTAQFPEAFSWEYLETGPEEFRVKITKLKAVTAAPTAPSAPPRSIPLTAKPSLPTNGNFLQVDARGLEPPEPLVRILSALETLPAGLPLRALTDREPCHLFGEAQQRGFKHECVEQPDHSWITVLERA